MPSALLLAMVLLLGPATWFGDVSDHAEAVDVPLVPLTVLGSVFDVDGDPISGANVTVTVLYANGTARAMRNCTSEPDGSYFNSSDFSQSEWDNDSRIEVVATFGGDYGLNSTTPTSDAWDYGLLYVNVTFPLKMADIVLSLSQGWNLVSVPVVSHGYKASTLPGLSKGDSVTGWNPATAKYNQTYVIGLSPLSQDFPIVGNTGYWFNVKAPRTLALKGDAPLQTQARQIEVPAAGGWALVGFNTLSADKWASNVSYLMWSSTGNLTTLSSYDPVIKKYKTYIRGVPSTDFLLIPGQGYWCYSTASGVLSYDP